MQTARSILVLFLMLSPAAYAEEPWKAPRKAHGAPDIEGVWTNITATPLERPAAFDAPTTTEERAAAFEKASPETFLADTSDGIGGRQSEWWEIGTRMTRIGGEIRTSLIVDPPSGKLPYSEQGRALLGARQKAVLQDYDGPEIRPSPERCLAGGSGATGAPMFTARYNGNYRIVQTEDHVVIAMEQNREVRIVPLSVGQRPAPELRRWMGYSVGRWEGETLVVETTGFKPGDAFKPSSPIYVSENAKVTERFTRLSPDELLYQYEVDDPAVFSQSWRAEQVFGPSTGAMYEVACHEANYSLPGILAGGREQDRRRAAK
jgi:hypothetical protein